MTQSEIRNELIELKNNGVKTVQINGWAETITHTLKNHIGYLVRLEKGFYQVNV